MAVFGIDGHRVAGEIKFEEENNPVFFVLLNALHTSIEDIQTCTIKKIIKEIKCSHVRGT